MACTRAAGQQLLGDGGIGRLIEADDLDGFVRAIEEWHWARFAPPPPTRAPRISSEAVASTIST